MVKITLDSNIHALFIKIKNNLEVISLVLSILGLTSSLFVVYAPITSNSFLTYHFFDFIVFELLRLDFYDIDGGTFTGNRSYGGNGLNIAFNFVFVTASIIYIRSKKKEKHLLQFVYAIIHFSIWVSLFIFIFSQFRRFTLLDPISLLFLIRDLILLGLSYIILKITDEKLELSLNENSFEERKAFSYLKAAKYKRILHLVLDSFLYMSITFSAFRVVLPVNFLHSMTNALGDRYTLTILFAFSAITYYMIFEIIFKRTPAKYLTQTIVIGVDKLVVTPEMVLKKSLSRKIPFNTLSFLGEKGWHDSISNTQVVSLNNNKRDYKYLLLIPALAFFFYANYQFNEFREDYVTYKKQNNMLQNDIASINFAIENLKVLDIISLKETSEHYYDASHFLKVLAIDGDAIKLAKIKKNYDHKTLADVNMFHELNATDYEEIEVTKAYLRKGICNEFSFFSGFKNCGFTYFENEDAMRIYSIDNPFDPIIHYKSIFHNSKDMLTLRFESNGVQCQLIDIEIVEGDITINTTLPQKTTTFNNDFQTSMRFKEKISDFKLKLVFRNEVDQNLTYSYLFESDGSFKAKLIKIKK